MFMPQRVIFERNSKDYDVGKNIYEYFKDKPGVNIVELPINKVKSFIPGENLKEQYAEGKRTLVVGVKKSLKFQSCKPSANFQLPLVTGCMGKCEYCYLNTQLGDKPFVRVYVNIDDILLRAEKHIEERSPEYTIFEGAATSDPVPVEPYTGSLKKAIEFFGKTEKGRFRFVTKYNDLDSLLDADHKGHTEVRFSLNTKRVISEYEHMTASPELRIEAAAKMARAGYTIGFLIAPVFMYEGWKKEYLDLLYQLKERLPSSLPYPVMFEVISHRYTPRAKGRILQIFPETSLPMKDEERKFKYGQFGYGKYVYDKEQLEDMKEFFKEKLPEVFGNCTIKYII